MGGWAAMDDCADSRKNCDIVGIVEEDLVRDRGRVEDLDADIVGRRGGIGAIFIRVLCAMSTSDSGLTWAAGVFIAFMHLVLGFFPLALAAVAFAALAFALTAIAPWQRWSSAVVLGAGGGGGGG